MTALHILAGLLSLAAGAVALYAAKGQHLHRKSGVAFVYAMLFMSGSGTLMAAMKPQPLSVVGGLLTFYMVTTGVLTVKRPAPRFLWLDTGAMLLGLSVGLYAVLHGLDLMMAGKRGAIYLAFGSVALLAAHGDWRMKARGGWQGAQRIARHLWRMCFAMSMATMSFFLGQAKLFPAAVQQSQLLAIPVQQSQLLAIPVLLVVLAMIYWLVRVLRARRPVHP